MSERDELARIIRSNLTTAISDFQAQDVARAVLDAGYVKADHIEYALNHKRADLQFTDDNDELWTDEDYIKDYAEDFGDTAPLVHRHVTIWEPTA